MTDAVQLEERQPGSLTPEERRRRTALGFLVPGLVWYALIFLTWLIWWQLGPEGRERLAGTMSLSANQFAICLWPFLILENIIAKSLLIAAFFSWVRARP